MENEEMIRLKMEKTREALTEKLETLEQKVVDSVTAVTETVTSVKEKMNEGVETVKDAMDVQAHVERHPWLMFGGSVLCGYLLGNLLTPERGERRDAIRAQAPGQSNGNGRHLWDQPQAAAPASNWLGAFEPELRGLKKLAVGVTLGAVRDMLTAQVPPHMADQLRSIADAITMKVGGEPIPSSDWDAINPAAARAAGPECGESAAQNPRW